MENVNRLKEFMLDPVDHITVVLVLLAGLMVLVWLVRGVL
jgi:hypothetical protein